MVWIVVAHALNLVNAGPSVSADATATQVLAKAASQTGSWLRQEVASVGSLEAPSPLATYLFWWLAVGSVAAAAFLVGKKRELATLASLIFIVFVLPVLIEFPGAKRVGLVWQGRYTLPLAVGIPLLATAIIGNSRLPSRLTRRMAAFLVVGVPTASVLAFAGALRRFMVGVKGPIDFLRGPWQPPGGAVLVLVWYGVASALFAGTLWYCMRVALRPAEGDDERFQPIRLRSASF
jgi:hypothetical protein